MKWAVAKIFKDGRSHISLEIVWDVKRGAEDWAAFLNNGPISPKTVCTTLWRWTMISGWGIIFVRQDGERSPLALPGTWRLDEEQAQEICDSLNRDAKDGMYYPIEIDDDMAKSDDPSRPTRPRAI